MKHLTKIQRDIQLRCSCAAKVPFTNDLGPRLQHLTPLEKSIIADFVYELEYDIGTGRILALLHEISLISVHHYVNRIEDTDLLLNIYNDFLENQPVLFGALVEGARASVQLRAALDDFLEDFLKDDGVRVNPFMAVFDVLGESDAEFLVELILNNFLKLENRVTIEKCLQEQHLWTNERSIQVKIVMDCLLIGSGDNFFGYLHKNVLSKTKFEVNWKSYCVVLGVMTRVFGQKLISQSKKLLQDDFKKFIKDRNEFLLHFILLTVRQISLSSPNEVKYGDWYKQNIGEMMYTIEKEDFLFVMRTLTKMIELEGNPEFISTHIGTRIQAPPLCNETVFTYKAILRSRLETINNKNTPEVIEIDL